MMIGRAADPASFLERSRRQDGSDSKDTADGHDLRSRVADTDATCSREPVALRASRTRRGGIGMRGLRPRGVQPGGGGNKSPGRNRAQLASRYIENVCVPAGGCVRSGDRSKIFPS